MTNQLLLSRSLFLCVSLTLGSACAPDAPAALEDPVSDGSEPFDAPFVAAGAISTVDEAVREACATTAVAGLNEELIEELNCIDPGFLDEIDDIPGVELGSTALPYLQTPAAEGLREAALAAGSPIRLNSTIRTLAQQFLLYRWRELGRCGQDYPVATPGSSNHHSGIAIDVDNWSDESVREALVDAGFAWSGSADEVHFRFTDDVEDVRSYSVLAFQRLWNQAHPDEPLEEDGDYGPLTRAALERAPARGFGLGPTCGVGRYGPTL